MQPIKEHSSSINIEVPKKDVHKKMPTFYNPKMKSNRNISILLLNSIPNKNMNIALPLAGSGIRGLRFLKELGKNKINHLFINDKKENFTRETKKTLASNNLKPSNLSINNEEASLFLLNQTESKKKPKNFCGYFDYIDIDPFGSPNSFLDAAVSRIPRDGILAVTATDTAALTGTYPKVTKRKYWSTPLRNHLMHEVGLRILIRKVQLHGLPFDKALIPILSYHKDHYFRVYFRSEKGKQKCDAISRNHQYLLFDTKTLTFRTSRFNKEVCFNQFAGPLWTGKLFDPIVLRKMVKNNPFPEEQKFLALLLQEKDMVGFYDLHILAKKYKKEPPKMDDVLKKVKGTRTHFSRNGVKTEASISEILKIFH